VCRTVSTDALQVLMGVPSLDLEVARRALMLKIKRGLPLSMNDWINQTVLGLSVKERQKLLHDCVRDRCQARWNECENGRVRERRETRLQA